MRFDSYHPLIIFLYFATVLMACVSFNHPVFLGISYLCAFLYSVKLEGKKIVFLNTVFFLLSIGYTLYFSSYEHFGITILMINKIGNHITLEALLCGFTKGITMAAVCMWSICIFKLMTTDKIVYLLGVVFPRLSLFFTLIFRVVPRINMQAKQIDCAREAIGKGIRQGKICRRLLHLISILSILISWLSEDFAESADSMKSRGYSLKKRTSYSIYRFDNRDRFLVIVFFFCLMVMGLAAYYGHTRIYFEPRIIFEPGRKISYFFYFVYFFYLLLPMGLQIIAEYRWKHIKTKNTTGVRFSGMTHAN